MRQGALLVPRWVKQSVGHWLCPVGVRCSYSVWPPRGTRHPSCIHLPLVLQPVHCFCTHKPAPSVPAPCTELGGTLLPAPTFQDPLQSFTAFPSPKPRKQPQLLLPPPALPSPLLSPETAPWELDLSGLNHNAASTKSCSPRSSCQNLLSFSELERASPRAGVPKLTMHVKIIK